MNFHRSLRRNLVLNASLYFRKSSKNAYSTVDSNLPIQIENPYKSTAERCTLCGVRIDYKNVQLLSQLISSFSGLRIPQKSTSLCEQKYEEVTHAIGQSRKAGFMPYSLKETVFLDDPTITPQRFNKPKK